MANLARLNLTGAAFPLLSTKLGSSVMARHEYDTNYVISNEYSGTQADRDIGIPTHMYMHNIVPTTYGVKSIGFEEVVGSLGDDYRVFDKMLLLRAQDETKVFFSPARGRNYILGAVNPNAWVSFPFPALQNGRVTHAYVNGKTYIAYQQQGMYEYDPVLNTFTIVNPIGIVGSSVHGVCNANNYLIVWDSTTVYWSSAIDALEFTPSLSTTSGSGKVQAARGAIVCCLPIHDGFIVYTTANAIVANFTGNTRFPWSFKEIPGSAGIVDPEHVTYDSNYDVHFAWTTSGMLQVDKQRAVQVWPEVSDFLTERTIEYDIVGQTLEDYAPYWASETQILKATEAIKNFLMRVEFAENLRVKLTFLGSRYIFISYGAPNTDEFLYALVYDLALKRWGKIKIPHVDFFTWVKPNYKYNAIEPKKSIGVLGRDGKISVVDFGATTQAKDSLYMFGRIKPRRERVSTLHSIRLETVPQNSNFNIKVLSSTINNIYPKMTNPILAIRSNDFRKYNLRTTGFDHILVLRGTFDLSNCEIEFSLAGVR